MTIAYRREHFLFERIVARKSFWVFFVFMAFAVPIYKSVHRKLPAPLSVYFKLPEYKLINEFGKNFGTSDMKGKPYIASFAFTSCPSTCPRLMQKMQIVQKRVRGLGTSVGLLTFTVDPNNDTPKVLHKYAKDLHANPFVWHFLTGTEKELRDIVVKGFKVPMGEIEEVTKLVDTREITLLDIAHTERFVLVDGKGQVRNYYSVEEDGINQLMIDLALLINREAFKL